MSDEIKPCRILCVDDEKSVLMSIKRVLRSAEYKVTIATSGQEGLDLIADEEPFDVIISDMRMPEMDGAEFLAAASQFTPYSIRILLTGYSDQEATIRAINDGKIFRYLNKPWNNDELRQVVGEAIQAKKDNDEKRRRSQRLAKATRLLKERSEGLENQVKEANQELEMTVSFLDLAKEELQTNYLTLIKSFSSLINLRVGNSHQLTISIMEDAVSIGKKLGLDADHLTDLEHAAMLCQLGKMALPDELLTTPLNSLNEQQLIKYLEYPVIGEQILMPIQALSAVSNIIRHHNENFGGKGYPDQLIGSAISLSCRILRVTLDFNQLLEKEQKDPKVAKQYLIDNKYSLYDPSLVDLYIEIIDAKQNFIDKSKDTIVNTAELRPEMIISKDMYNNKGLLILSKNTIVSEATINKLKSFERMGKEKFAIRVFFPDEILANNPKA